MFSRCAMLSDSNIDLFPCQDPCKTDKCPIGYKCVPDPKVCLSLMHKPCTQFMCGKYQIICFRILH